MAKPEDGRLESRCEVQVVALEDLRCEEARVVKTVRACRSRHEVKRGEGPGVGAGRRQRERVQVASQRARATGASVCVQAWEGECVRAGVGGWVCARLTAHTRVCSHHARVCECVHACACVYVCTCAAVHCRIGSPWPILLCMHPFLVSSMFGSQKIA